MQALAGLSHPNLITLFDASITGSPAFLVMELVDGPSLAERLSAGPILEADVRDVGAQIADALGYVHAQRMVHRDVKPANILLGADGTAGPGTTWARLSDFGIVRLLGSVRMTSVELTVGSASYLAPEQVRGADVGTEADIYSLGLVLLESLTGIRSFDGAPMEAAMARLSRSPEVPTTLPLPWPELLAAMTAAEPTVRPTAVQVVDSLRNDQFEAGTAAGPAGETRSTKGAAKPRPACPRADAGRAHRFGRLGAGAARAANAHAPNCRNYGAREARPSGCARRQHARFTTGHACDQSFSYHQQGPDHAEQSAGAKPQRSLDNIGVRDAQPTDTYPDAYQFHADDGHNWRVGATVVIAMAGVILDGVRRKFEKELGMQELTGPARNIVVRSRVDETIARRIAFAAAPARWTGS